MKKNGSITIFLAMLLTAVFAAVFAFLEAARVSGLSANVTLSTMQARDAVLASYDRDVEKRYDILFWKCPDGDQPALSALGSLQQVTVEGNRKETILPRDNYYVLGVHLAEVNIPVYQLATDQGGAPFRAQAAKRMQESVAKDALSAAVSWMNESEQQRDSAPDLEGQALQTLQDYHYAQKSFEEQRAEKMERDESTQVKEVSQTDLQTLPETEMSENPLEWVKKAREKGLYSLVLPEEEMSEKQVDLTDTLGKRILLTGNDPKSPSGSMPDKFLFHLYLEKYFREYTDNNYDAALDYEMEYIIAGKASDRENLKHVIRRLMLVRETSNLAFLETNTSKQEEAAAIAAALSAAILSPELEPALQQGILAAWALAESVSDVRILMEGGKVSLIKTEDQWHTEIGNLSSSVYSGEAQRQQRGLSYANYLQVLLWTASEQQVAYRAMDLIEKNTGVRMDQMLAAADCVYTYEASPLFWNFVTLGTHSPGTYRFRDETRITFLQE